MGQNNFAHITALMTIVLGEAWWVVVGSVNYHWRYCGFRFHNFQCAGVATTWLFYGGYSTFELIFWIYAWMNAATDQLYKDTFALIGVVIPLALYGIPTGLFILAMVYDADIGNYDAQPHFIWMFGVSIGLWFLIPITHLFLLDEGASLMYWRIQMMRAIGVTGVRPASIAPIVNDDTVIIAPVRQRSNNRGIRVVKPRAKLVVPAIARVNNNGKIVVKRRRRRMKKMDNFSDLVCANEFGSNKYDYECETEFIEY
jgi:hypothetical protein